MRRIVMFNWLTADGYFAGPDGNLQWVVPDEEQAKAAAEGISGGTPSTTPPPRRTPTVLDYDLGSTVPLRSG